ncbi:MAG: hypothetical protein PHQ96_00670 [Candidatus Omnitrophica bacterium]|nr:hypothetical protein [Candidatus Omnitrophota bacterium]
MNTIAQAEIGNFQGIEIVGSHEFVLHVGKALGLLNKNAFFAFNTVKEYVGRIQESPRSGMNVYINPPTFELSAKSAFYSLTWCAGIIAHDAYHSQQYFSYQKIHGDPVPAGVWTGKDAEIECLNFQKEAMRAIGAPDKEIDYVASVEPTYYDVNKDGRYDQEDYLLRDW